MKQIFKIEQEVLSDGSKVYNIIIVDHDNRTIYINYESISKNEAESKLKALNALKFETI